MKRRNGLKGSERRPSSKRSFTATEEQEPRNDYTRKQNGGNSQIFTFSIFRPVLQSSLGDLQEQFETLSRQYTSLQRGTLDQHGYAATLLAKTDTRNRKFIKGIQPQDILEAVYDSVLSLRSPMEVDFQNIGLFGSKKFTNVSVALAIGKGKEQLTEERESIINVVNEFIAPSYDDSSVEWVEKKNPHISLGRINLPFAGDKKSAFEIKQHLNAFIPDSPITIQRAEFR